MKTKQQLPERFWVGQPAAHQKMTNCGKCAQGLDLESSIPVLSDPEASDGRCPLCFSCALEEIGSVGTPQTAEYARWLSDGDPRWWSKYLCSCSACYAKIQQGGTT